MPSGPHSNSFAVVPHDWRSYLTQKTTWVELLSISLIGSHVGIRPLLFLIWLFLSLCLWLFLHTLAIRHDATTIQRNRSINWRRRRSHHRRTRMKSFLYRSVRRTEAIQTVQARNLLLRASCNSERNNNNLLQPLLLRFDELWPQILSEKQTCSTKVKHHQASCIMASNLYRNLSAIEYTLLYLSFSLSLSSIILHQLLSHCHLNQIK